MLYFFVHFGSHKSNEKSRKYSSLTRFQQPKNVVKKKFSKSIDGCFNMKQGRIFLVNQI